VNNLFRKDFVLSFSQSRVIASWGDQPVTFSEEQEWMEASHDAPSKCSIRTALNLSDMAALRDS
jgi:hypothetical protein